MPTNLTSLSKHKKQFQTKAMKVPVIFHASETLLPNEETFAELENLARDKRIFHHIAALSDVHSKKGRKNPTGTVVASKKYLFPQINDTAPNCGMRFLRTNLDEKNFTEDKIDLLFKKIVEIIPTKKYIGNKIPFPLVMDICTKGIAPLLNHLKAKTKNEIENCFAQGNFFQNEEITNRDIFDVIPKLFLRIASYRLGILGAAGNHFLDLMKITEIHNQEIASNFNLKNGQYIFLLHTGSGLLGQYASYMYTPKEKEHLSQKLVLKIGTFLFDSQLKKVYTQINQKIKVLKKSEDFLGYENDSLEARMFWRAQRAAANFGFANRSMITHNLNLTLNEVVKGQAEMDMLYDAPHISINKENHFGQNVWIHRNGAVRANGPARMINHPLFSQTGEPVFIPSSMNTPAYLAVGTDENESTFFSAGHGTGRRREAEYNKPKNKSELLEKMRKCQVRLYNAKSKGVVFQDSTYYKDVKEVIEGMVENKIVKVVAKMEPVAVLMY